MFSGSNTRCLAPAVVSREALILLPQIVAPKKANLAQAEAELAETMAILDEKRAQVSYRQASTD